MPGWRVFLGAQERMALRVCSGRKAASQYMMQCHMPYAINLVCIVVLVARGCDVQEASLRSLLLPIVPSCSRSSLQFCGHHERQHG